MVGKLKAASGQIKGPAIAVGAAAAGVAGVAGGLALKSRRGSRRTVLGVHVPRSLTTEFDVRSVAKSVGKASKRVGETSKSVSKDMERLGQQAERIGKILG